MLPLTNNFLCVKYRGCSLPLSESIYKGAETESNWGSPFRKDNWAEAATGSAWRVRVWECMCDCECETVCVSESGVCDSIYGWESVCVHVSVSVRVCMWLKVLGSAYNQPWTYLKAGLTVQPPRTWGFPLMTGAASSCFHGCCQQSSKGMTLWSNIEQSTPLTHTRQRAGIFWSCFFFKQGWGFSKLPWVWSWIWSISQQEGLVKGISNLKRKSYLSFFSFTSMNSMVNHS